MKIGKQKIKLNTAIVVFIDILGFRNRIYDVDSDESLLRAYQDIRILHKLFDKEPDSKITRASQKIIAKTVLAFTDALIISLDFESVYAKVSGIFDTISSELYIIGLNQANAITRGIFLRGGIASGFYFSSKSEDIIISSAMVKAYETENKTVYPIISLNEQFYEYFANHPDNDVYADENAPCYDLIASFDHPANGDKIYFIDYFHITVGAAQNWFCDEDRKKYIAEKDHGKKKEILNTSYLKNELSFVEAHKNAIKAELEKNHAAEIIKKYIWLKDYHNKSVEEHGYPSQYKI